MKVKSAHGVPEGNQMVSKPFTASDKNLSILNEIRKCIDLNLVAIRNLLDAMDLYRHQTKFENLHVKMLLHFDKTVNLHFKTMTEIIDSIDGECSEFEILMKDKRIENSFELLHMNAITESHRAALNLIHRLVEMMHSHIKSVTTTTTESN
jgi:hypothetical protein